MTDKQFLIWLHSQVVAPIASTCDTERFWSIISAMPEESVTQTEPPDTEVARIKKTLETLIAWSVRDLGEAGVKQLLDMLNPPTDLES